MDEWLQHQVDPHVLEVGEMNMTKDLGQIEEDRHLEDLDRYDRWNQEIGGKIEDARDSVMSCVDELRAQTAEVEWRVREEEVSARERLTYEHQAQEAQLLSALRGRRGSLLPILNDKFSWTIEWRRAPQEFQLNVTSIRGMRGKLRDGYYVVLASIIDRLSGQTLRFSTGEHNLDCCAALPPIRHCNKSSEVDRVINQSDAIPLRRPLYVKDLISHNLGSYKLGDDILEFMKRNFPHMTNMNSYRVGDVNEDFYYEADLMHDVQMRMTPHDDDQEMRRLLKAYFHAQVYTGKPVEWDLNDNKKFVVKDTQMLADLIFFETSSAMIRALFLSLYLHSHVPNYFSIDADDPNTSQVADMPNFDRTNPLPSMNGLPVKGSIVHIVLENPVKKTKQLSRSFVATPFGVIIEAKSKSFSFLAHHTADHPEFWAAKAILMDFKKASEYLGKDDEAASELVLDTTERRAKK
ncbi:Hypothetical protein, putative [Bodo saltans]|uniref:Uncharacterized protein n=1 Tax=Bodo saltans TaxID=75058 RepID=A0A0S4J5Q3_BODSA|nr:Hypothetical protein, putative [Bodo saltans]|eukprot:CUG58968.1 Hypothetical protein, putative [Bodo saltans]